MKKFTSIIICAFLLCGCGNNNPAPQSSPQSVPQSTAQSTKSTPQSTAGGTQSSKASAASTTKSSMSSAESIPESTVTQDDIVFVDYKLTENYEGITDESLVAEQTAKAKEELKKLDTYKERSTEISFERVFVEDFDGDGKDDIIAVLSNPNDPDNNNIELFLITENGTEHIVTIYALREKARFDLLDYGCRKQLLFYSFSDSNTMRVCRIIGVEDGKAAALGEVWQCESAVKYGPFLTFETGFRQAPVYGFFDAKTKRYYSSEGKRLTANELAEMDKTDSLNKLPDTDKAIYRRLGGKYYTITVPNGDLHQDFSVLSYENGAFTEAESTAIRQSGGDFTLIPELDYDKAVSSMITSEEARKLI